MYIDIHLQWLRHKVNRPLVCGDRDSNVFAVVLLSFCMFGIESICGFDSNLFTTHLNELLMIPHYDCSFLQEYVYGINKIDDLAKFKISFDTRGPRYMRGQVLKWPANTKTENSERLKLKAETALAN